MPEVFLILQLQQDTKLADVLFQQDGAPLHYHHRVTSFLDATLSNKWVGQGRPIGLPPWSPDLTPLYLHFWGYIKNKIYGHPLPQSLRKLQDRIHDTVVSVKEDMLHKVWDETCIQMECATSPTEAT